MAPLGPSLRWLPLPLRPPLRRAPPAEAPLVSVSGGLNYNYGVLGAASTDQQLTLGAQVTVNNLPAGVTVTSVTEQFFVQNRQGQTSPGPGAFFMGNVSTNWYKAADCTSVGCSVNWTGPAGPVGGQEHSTGPGTGWSSTVTNTQNLVNHTFSNGATYPAWDVNLSWTPTSTSAYTLTTNANGCTTFTTTPSGRFGVNYYGVTGATAGSTMCITADYHVTVGLSNGQTLSYLSTTLVMCP